MPSDRYDCGNTDFCNDGDKLHSIKTLEDFMSEKILLIDGHSILNRAFYGLPDLTNSSPLLLKNTIYIAKIFK